jgi:hypothetical protein
MDRGRLIDVLEKNLERQIDFVKSADVKATILFALMGGYVAASVQAKIGVLERKPTGDLLPINPNGWFFLFSVLFAILATACLMLVTFADIKMPRSVRPPVEHKTETEKPEIPYRYPSVLYFGHIADTSMDDFNASVRGLSENAYIHDLVSQCHINSKIAQRKHWRIQQAIKLAGLSLLCFFAFQITMQKEHVEPASGQSTLSSQAQSPPPSAPSAP